VRLDEALPATYAAKNAVGKIAVQTGTPTGGTYTITVTVPTYNNGRSLTYTTAAIAYNATAATIQAALDTASPAGITNAAIVVAEENSAGLSDGYCTFTCAQELVGNQLTLATTDSLTGGTTPASGAVTYTTYGQPKRNALYALVALSVITIASLHNVGASATLAENTSRLVKRPRRNVLRDLTEQLRVEEGNNYAAEEMVRLFPWLETEGPN
jgi:hypothetical protein